MFWGFCRLGAAEVGVGSEGVPAVGEGQSRKTKKPTNNKQNNRNKLTDLENKWVVVKWKGGGWVNKGKENKAYKIPVIKKSQGCTAQHREYPNI